MSKIDEMIKWAEKLEKKSADRDEWLQWEKENLFDHESNEERELKIRAKVRKELADKTANFLKNEAEGEGEFFNDEQLDQVRRLISNFPLVDQMGENK